LKKLATEKSTLVKGNEKTALMELTGLKRRET